MSIKTTYQQHIGSKNPERFNEELLCQNKNAGSVFFDKGDISFVTANWLRYKCLCT